MNQHTLSESDLNLIRRFLMKSLSPSLLILFGSAVEGGLRPDSDLDLAFLSNNKTDPY